MTNTELFMEKLRNSGINQKELASAIGLSRQSLSYKVNNKREFVPSEINKICEILGILDLEEKQAIFFAA